MFPHQLIEELKTHHANRLEEIIADDGIKLTAHGSSLVGYHSNKHSSQSGTSLQIDSQRQLYRCWNCNEGGDVINWLEKNRNLSFFQSCEYLAKRAEIELPGISPHDQEKFEQFRIERAELERLYQATADIYHNQLLEKHYALLLGKWGLTAETVKELKIGYSPPGKFIAHELKKKGFSSELIFRSGLLNKGEYDHFKGRLVFPYHKNKQVVYFIARKTEDTPGNEYEKSKFKKLLTHNKNNPHVSQAVKNEYFAGEDTARGADELLITEGIADCYAAIQAGFSCISPVTVRFREADFPRLAILANRAKCVYIVNDNEDSKAGEKGATATAEYLESKGIAVKLIELPKPDDVDKIDLADYLKEHTEDDLKELMAKAKTLFERCLAEVADEPANSDKCQKAINLLAKMNGMELDRNLEKLCQILKSQGIRKKTLEDEVDKKAKENIAKQNTSDESKDDEKQTETPLAKSKKALEQTDPELIEKARQLLNDPKLIYRMIQHIEMLGLVGERGLSLTLYLIGTSRLLTKPLAAIVLGSSSSGKSFSISTTAKLFPDEVVLKAHRMTTRALEYVAEGSLENCYVVAGERSRKQDDDQAEATRALREMISEGELSLLATGKDENGNNVATLIHRKGPISYVESSTLGLNQIFPEDRTRFLILCSDESRKQNEKVIRSMADCAKSPKPKGEIDSIVMLHWTVQRLLQPHSVIIPYADKLTGFIPADRPEVRRVFGQLLDMVRAVALLHQFQRKKDPDGNIIAEYEDYQIVKEFLTEPLARGLGVTMTPGASQLLEVATELDDFTVSDLVTETGLQKSILYSRVNELLDHGQIEKTQEHSGRKPARYKVCENPKAVDILTLPDIEEETTPDSNGKAETKI